MKKESEKDKVKKEIAKDKCPYCKKDVVVNNYRELVTKPIDAEYKDYNKFEKPIQKTLNSFKKGKKKVMKK